MKVTVWTSWNIHLSHRGRPKCIFMGEISNIPEKGSQIIAREGFGCERVHDIYYDLTNDSIEIHLDTCDPDNAYGKCLYNKELLWE